MSRPDQIMGLTDDLSRLIADFAPPLLILDRDLRLCGATPAAERLLHIGPAQVGQAIDAIELPTWGDELRALAHRAMTARTISERDVRDDGGRWYSMLVQPYWSAINHVEGVVVVLRESELRQRAVQQAERNRQQLMAIVQALSQPLLLLDADLRVCLANTAFCATFQSTPMQLVGSHFFELDDGGWDVAGLREQLQQMVVKPGWIENLEAEHDFKALGRRTVVINARRLDFGEGRPFILLGTDDVTVQRRIERYERVLAEVSEMATVTLDAKALVEGVAQLVVPALADWVIVDTRDDAGLWSRSCVLHRNPEMQDAARRVAVRAFANSTNPVFGVLDTGEPLVAERISSDVLAAVVDVADRSALPELLTPRSLKIVPLASQNEILGAITLISVSVGTHLVPSMLPRAEELGRRVAFGLERIKIHRDMSVALDVARSANEAKSRFLANMSHELRTPLNAILGYEQLLQMELHGPLTAAQRKALERIDSSQHHLTALIDDILSFAKLEAGAISFELETVTVDRVIAASLDMIATQLQRKNLDYEYQRCAAECTVYTDPARLQQVLVNLLSNATKFTHAGGRVQIQCVPHERTVDIRVIDTGIGIPGDKREAVFEPFVQLDNALNRRGSGTGLGLAISRDLARAMGGELRLVSREGEGSTFTLTIPRGT
ncbi:MAG: ATP-binding protein, partial [Gemmatimonadaceae bacterium]